MQSYTSIVATFLLACLISCSQDKYDPSHELDTEKQSRLLRQMVYYSAKLPPNANELDKFNEQYNWYYDRAAKETMLWHLHIGNQPNTWYFLVARQARSITPMKEGIGGKVKLNADGSLADYEEVFRTWKMSDDTLKKRARFLFDRMVNGKDLSLYYAKFQGDRFIEYPSEGFYFDQLKKRWRRQDAIVE